MPSKGGGSVEKITIILTRQNGVMKLEFSGKKVKLSEDLVKATTNMACRSVEEHGLYFSGDYIFPTEWMSGEYQTLVIHQPTTTSTMKSWLGAMKTAMKQIMAEIVKPIRMVLTVEVE